MPREDKIELTEALVKSLQPNPSKDTYYNDDKLDGLVLIVRKGGRKVYALRTYDKNKKQIKRTIGNADQISLKAARTAAKIWCSQLVQGQDPFITIDRPDKSRYVPAIIDKWLAWSQTHPTDPMSLSQRPNVRNYLGAFRRYLADTAIDHIDDISIEDFRAKLAVSNIAASRNRYVRELQFLATWAKDHKLIDNHHLSGIKPEPETDSTPKTDHFTDAERAAIKQEALAQSTKSYFGRSMAYIYPLTLLFLETGLRPGEGIGLEWDDVDLDDQKILVRAVNAKTKKDRYVYISTNMAQLLRKWKLQTTGRPKDTIFPGDGRRIHYIYKQYKNLFKRAGIDYEKYSTYSMRHDCASEILVTGGNITDAQMMLGHAKPSTTMKYAHPSADHLKDVAERLSRKQSS